MKKLLILLLALLLVGCSEKPGLTDTTGPSTTEATVPEDKTVWVRTSQTSETQGMVSRTELIYDNNNRVTEVIVWVNDTETAHYTAECDENGNVSELNSLDETQKYAFDEAGRLLSCDTYAEDRLTHGLVYTYDEAGRRIRQEVTIGALGVSQRTDYIYNEAGHNIRQEFYSDGELVRYCDCICDENGRILTMNGFTATGTADLITEYTYDGSVETQVSRTPDGQLVQTILILRDSWDNIIRTESYSAAGALLVTEVTTWKPITVPGNCPRASI